MESALIAVLVLTGIIKTENGEYKNESRDNKQLCIAAAQIWKINQRWLDI